MPWPVKICALQKALGCRFRLEGLLLGVGLSQTPNPQPKPHNPKEFCMAFRHVGVGLPSQFGFVRSGFHWHVSRHWGSWWFGFRGGLGASLSAVNLGLQVLWRGRSKFRYDTICIPLEIFRNTIDEAFGKPAWPHD